MTITSIFFFKTTSVAWYRSLGLEFEQSVNEFVSVVSDD